jgi:hypothetical protein
MKYGKQNAAHIQWLVASAMVGVRTCALSDAHEYGSEALATNRLYHSA